MSRVNQAPTPYTHPTTHEGGKAARKPTPVQELERTIMACMLWEDGFYEAGLTLAERVKSLVPKCDPQEVSQLAIDARTKQNLRHVPLLIVRELARDAQRCPKGLISETLASVIQRADELAEFLAIYWKEGKKPISKQVKKGLAEAFGKFNEYALAKYNRDSKVKLRDVLFMIHAKPKDDEQADLWKRLVEGKLETPDTWEVALSSGADKKASFERLMSEKKLGYLALLRNLRNMQQAEVDTSLIFPALLEGAGRSKVLPFRFVAAARAVPAWEPQLDEAMQKAMEGLEKWPGKTTLLVDVSGSMDEKLSSKSDLTRLDAASALAVLVQGIAEHCRVFTFSSKVVEVPPRKGMALVDAIDNSQQHGNTFMGEALKHIQKIDSTDRLIVITDEQSHDRVGSPYCPKGYIINVATNAQGVGYGPWTTISGFSEAVIQYIQNEG